MKKLTAIFIIFFLSFSYAEVSLYKCFPSSKVSTSPTETSRTVLNKLEADKNFVEIVQDGKNIFVKTRNNKEVKTSTSGIYEYYFTDAITIKIDKSNKEYFELVSLGLSTIYYHGQCK